ncbi:MAG TPA: DUF1365 domain-containing protein [Steroidobacteraceae bacterium]
MHSALYTGSVRHRRFTPRPHAFSYAYFMLYLDLAELPQLFKRRWLWGAERRALAAFRRADHLGDPAVPLDAAVRELVATRTGRVLNGAVRLLTNLRYFGYGFNPVSFYYCFDAADEHVEVIVAEVNNTPWGEQHCYVLDVGSAASAAAIRRWTFDKVFHVSPFMPMDMQYDWRFSAPGAHLATHIVLSRGGQCVFDASMALSRRPISAGSLAWLLLRFPWISARVVVAIYWQAFRLWLKRVPFCPHPAPPSAAGAAALTHTITTPSAEAQ